MKSVKSVFKTALFIFLIAGLRLTPVYSQTPSIPAEVAGQTYYAAFTKTIAIDGDFSDWAGIPQANVSDGPQPAANPADGSMTFAVSADGDNLYFSAHVADSNIIAGKHGADYWNEDSVEIYINATNNFDLTSYANGVAQITIPAADIGLPSDQAIISGQTGAGLGVKTVVVKSDNGYALEAAIPLHTSVWNITPANGGTLGFEVQLNGATQTDRDIKLSWSAKNKAQDQAYQSPSVFGQLSFFQIDGMGVLPPATIAPEQPTTIPPTDLPIATLPPPQTTNVASTDLLIATLPPPQTTNIVPTDLPIATLPPPQVTSEAPTDQPSATPPILQPTISLPTDLPIATLPPPQTTSEAPTDQPAATSTPEVSAPTQEPLSLQATAAQTYNAVFPKTITIDGNFSDWTGLAQASVTTGPLPSPNPSVDGSMTFATAADANNLYFMANVLDKNIIAGKHGADYWNEDSVEIYINATGNLNLTSYTNGVAQITIPAANIGKTGSQVIISGQTGPSLGVKAIVVKVATGYAMEVAIPLRTSAWNITPSNGRTLGFEVQLNDATQTNRNIKLSWSNKDQVQDLAYTNPSVFAQLTFSQLSTNTPVPTPTPTVKAPTSSGFSVQGSTIIAPNGQPFVAKGVNVNGSNWVWQRSTVNDAHLIADCWKFNLVRVNSFLFSGEQPWPLYTDNNNLDAIIQTYTSRGIVVLLEAHDRIGSYYQGNDLTRLVSWFTTLATRYRGNPYVWFDVANEPGGRSGIDATNWLNMHQQVIHAIRDTAGASNIIMVEGATGGQDAGRSGSGTVQTSDSAILQYGRQVISFNGKTYPNIIFSIHPYDLWNSGDAKMANFFDRVKAAKLALVVGEYGVQTDQNTTSAASSVINTASPRGIGRIVWHWDGHDYNDLTANTSWGGGWEINSCTSPSNLSWLGLSVWNDNHR